MRDYDDVTPMVSPNQFRSVNQHDSINGVGIHSQASSPPTSQHAVFNEATVTKVGDRFGAHGYAETATDSTSVTQPGSYRTPLRGVVASIHAARQATHNLGRSG